MTEDLQTEPQKGVSCVGVVVVSTRPRSRDGGTVRCTIELEQYAGEFGWAPHQAASLFCPGEAQATLDA